MKAWKEKPKHVSSSSISGELAIIALELDRRRRFNGRFYQRLVLLGRILILLLLLHRDIRARADVLHHLRAPLFDLTETPAAELRGCAELVQQGEAERAKDETR